jgi:hypothetical protein
MNMKILCDVCAENFSKLYLYDKYDSACLKAVRLYQKGQEPESQYVYLLKASELGELSAKLSHMSYVVFGKADIQAIPQECAVLIVEDCEDFSVLFTLLQDTFEKYQRWNQELHAALTDPHPLDAMLNASYAIFQNPIFIHDTSFYILSCPHTTPRMTVWEKDPRTGWDMVPFSVINDFKADAEYLRTLTTTEPNMFSADQRGYRILYINIWNQGHYQGRICVNELESSLFPGHYHAIRHLAALIMEHLQSRSLFQLNMGNDIEAYFRDLLDGVAIEPSRTLKILQFLKWKQHDRYLCLRLEAIQQNVKFFSSAATLGHIETQIPDGHAFIYKDGFTVIVNLTYSQAQVSDVVSSLAILLREGLLKMGVSMVIKDFMHISQGCYQAQMALEIGLTGTSTNWCYYFDDHILEFLRKKGCEILTPELLCSHKLLILREYDKTNHTDLFHTLKIYLELERNVLQTARALYIHRSTLFYRLERIQKIAQVNLDDSKERLLLRFSFYILEENKI